MSIWRIIYTSLLIIMTLSISAQEEEDLLSLLGEEETTNYTTASFKANRVVNLHSLENTSAGELDIKISHRFGFLNGSFMNCSVWIRPRSELVVIMVSQTG